MRSDAMTAEVGQPLDDAAGRLTVRGIPVDPNLRVLAVATLVNTVGNGALMTTRNAVLTHSG